MSIITLITDFGYKDHFVAKIKGQIYKKSSDIVDKVNIVDISHEVSPFNIMEAAYILQSSFNNFPNGTIHIIDVDSEKNIENSHIVMVFDSHYFICADNGIIPFKYRVVTNICGPQPGKKPIRIAINGINI